jgi:hypothetical protein
MAKGQQLAQLRSALASLESYELPERYLRPEGAAEAVAAEAEDGENGDPNRSAGPSSSSSSASKPSLPPASVARYRAARDTYLRQRTSDLFLQHLASFDGAGFSYPPPSDPGQEGALAGREERSRAQLAELAASVEDRLGTVRARYAALVERREELGRIVSEMEEREEDGGAGRAAEEDDDATMGPGGGGEDGDVDVDDEEMASQEERLAGLIERKAEVEARLRRVRAQRASVDADVGANRREVAELRRRNAGKGAAEEEEEVQNNQDQDDGQEEDWSGLSAEQIEERTGAALRAVGEMRDAAEWYDGMREAIEELGGMRIEGVEGNGSGGLVVRVRLLDEHLLEVGLESRIVRGGAGAGAGGGGEEVLRASSARLTTPTAVVCGSAADPAAPAAEAHIRQPGDLIALAANLPPVDDLRFVVRETQGRIRAAVGRASELDRLRSTYLTRIGPVPRDSDEQEVVCSLPAGVTAVLRLCADCPLAAGAAYMGQIVGVGGWDQADLDAIRDRVNSMGHCGPVGLMDALVDEIQRKTTSGVTREEEDRTVELPKTPTLPVRR